MLIYLLNEVEAKTLLLERGVVRCEKPCIRAHFSASDVIVTVVKSVLPGKIL